MEIAPYFEQRGATIRGIRSPRSADWNLAAPGPRTPSKAHQVVLGVLPFRPNCRRW
jgi:hypothetical protein